MQVAFLHDTCISHTNIKQHGHTYIQNHSI